MHDPTGYVIGCAFLIGIALLWALSTAYFATRKNRSGMAWAVAGFLLGPIPLLVLSFCGFLCPTCKNNLTTEEWKKRLCPRCAGDPNFMEEIADEQLSDSQRSAADALLIRASNAEIAGEYIRARDIYAQVSEHYPHSTFARDATRQIDILTREGKLQEVARGRES